MKLRRGTLVKLSKATGIDITSLCAYAAGRVRPRPDRARKLEAVCQELGVDVPAAVWVLGSSDQIKGRLSAMWKK